MCLQQKYTSYKLFAYSEMQFDGENRMNAKLKNIRFSYHISFPRSLLFTINGKTIHSSAFVVFYFSFLIFLSSPVCVYIYMCVYMYPCRFIQRLEVNIGCLFLLFSTLFLEVKSLKFELTP